MQKDTFLENISNIKGLKGNPDLIKSIWNLHKACFESEFAPDVRHYTNKLLELLDDGILSYEDVCKECIAEMSEDDVKDMYVRYLELPAIEETSSPCQYKDAILGLLDEGYISYETVCKECLSEMSEDDVESMCRTCEYVSD